MFHSTKTFPEFSVLVFKILHSFVPPKVNLDKIAKANKVVKMSGVVIDFSSIPAVLYLHHTIFVFFLQVFSPSFHQRLRPVSDRKLLRSGRSELYHAIHSAILISAYEAET